MLANEPVHAAFRAYCERGAIEHHVAVGRYVIMPDHVHLFVGGARDFDLGLWMRGLKRAVSKAAIEAAVSDASGNRPAAGTATTTTIWQPGFFDYLLRSNESYNQKWLYVRENPVRAGLVPHAEDWPYQGEIAPLDRL